MPDTIWFKPLHLADASRLRQDGSQLAGRRSLIETRQTIRQLMDLCNNQIWLTGQHDRSSQSEAVIGYQMIDPAAKRAVLHLFTESTAILATLLDSASQKAFRELGIFRLELTVPADKVDWLPIVHAAGFFKEGCLRSCLYDPITKRHQDVMLYSLLRPDSRQIHSAFVPFRLGLLAITGHEQALLATHFLRYGETTHQDLLNESLEKLGLLSSDGAVLTREALEMQLSGQTCLIQENAPELVHDAARQFAAYFAGHLTQFHIPLDLSCGSLFQQKVWQALSDIPFGATWTYEELAGHLGEEDWTAARKMARAVGSACGANPLPLILPCHRVIGKDGRLVGFSGGLDIKEYLLSHEMMGLND